MGAGCSTGNDVIRGSTTSLQYDESVPYKIIILGPRGAGKTFLLYSWLLGVDGVHSTKPTDEFNVETVRMKSNMAFTLWDISGNPTFRQHLKRKFNDGVQGIVFVWNTSDELKIARKDLQLVLEDPYLKNVPLLIVANQIVDRDSTPKELGDRIIDKSSLKDRNWHLTTVRFKSQADIDRALCDLQQLVTNNC